MRDFGLHQWGGLGLLYLGDYIEGYRVYYCPSYGGYIPGVSDLPMEYYWPNGDPYQNDYYIVYSWYQIRNAWGHDGEPHARGDGNGHLDHLGNRIAVWDSVLFGTPNAHGIGVNMGRYDGSVTLYEDPAGDFTIDVWSGGLDPYSRALALFDALDP